MKKKMKTILAIACMLLFVQTYAFSDSMKEATEGWLRSSSADRPGIGGDEQPDPKDDPDTSLVPVGDSLVWLLCIAGMYGGAVALRRRRT